MGATDGDEVMVSGMVENVCVCLKRILGGLSGGGGVGRRTAD